MSAYLLRRAAETLRAHAARTAVDPAAVKWAVSSTGLHMDNTAYYYLRPQPGRPSTWVGTAKCGVPEYIALMHPPVALAMAALLDEVAESVEQDGGVIQDATTAGAVDLARAILREERDDS